MAAKRGGGRIKTVVYLDVLLLTNFLTAYLLLLAAGALSGQRAPFARMLAGSALAALSALILFAPEQPYPVQVAYKAATALGITAAKEVRVGRDYMVVLESQQQVEALTPDIGAMLPLDKMVCVTAPGEEYDFVSRFFCPGEGVPEDPVTGSAHSMLIPYWSEKLGKTSLNARQVSYRGGDLRCELKGDRVLIGGQATLYLKGRIFLR